MLDLVNWIGRRLLCIFIWLSWADTDGPRARNFTLAAGSLAFGLILGALCYLLCNYLLSKFYPWCKLDGLTALVWIPAGTIIFTFVLESIKKQIQKDTGPT